MYTKTNKCLLEYIDSLAWYNGLTDMATVRLNRPSGANSVKIIVISTPLTIPLPTQASRAVVALVATKIVTSVNVPARPS